MRNVRFGNVHFGTDGFGTKKRQIKMPTYNK